MRQLLKNPHVKQVIDLSELSDIPSMYQEFSHDPKYIFVANNPWLTYNYVFRYAAIHIPKHEIVALVNNDIFLSHKSKWDSLNTFFNKSGQKKSVLALTRHEWGGTETTSTLDLQFQKNFGSNSQDAWIWKNHTIVPHSSYDIPIGILGCDNAILHRLLNVGGITPYNIGDTYKIFHYDKCRNKNASTAVHFHRQNQKQKSRGYENEGALTLPFVSRIDFIIENFNYMSTFKESLQKIRNFTLRYSVFLKILQSVIKIRN